MDYGFDVLRLVYIYRHMVNCCSKTAARGRNDVGKTTANGMHFSENMTAISTTQFENQKRY